MMFRSLIAGVALAGLPSLAGAADPTVNDLLDKMRAYEDQVRKLEERLDAAEKRAADAESELAQAKTGSAPPVMAATPVPPPPPAVVEHPPPAAPRHYKDKSAIPHGEGDGKFPNAWAIPGTDSYLAIGGYVKADVIEDFDFVGNATQFASNSIATEGSANAELGGQTTLTARETRINVDFHKPTSMGNLRAFVEGDFAGSGNSFRLRHAYGQVGGLLAGQTWTTFADLSSHPGTLDFEGPDASVMRRTTQLRYAGSGAPGWSWAVALEQPDASIQNAPGFPGAVRNELPDLPGFVRYQSGRGSLQLAGVLRQIRFAGEGGFGDDTATGYGASLSFTRHVFDSDVLSGQFVFGEGIAAYVQSLSGQGVDAFLDPAGSLETVSAASGMLALTHHWSPQWRSVVAYSLSDVEDEIGLPGGALDRLQDAHLNLIWSPFKSFEVGGEIMWGERRNQDGAEGDATRLQISAKYLLD